MVHSPESESLPIQPKIRRHLAFGSSIPQDLKLACNIPTGKVWESCMEQHVKTVNNEELVAEAHGISEDCKMRQEYDS